MRIRIQIRICIRPHWQKMLDPDPDPHWSQCGSATLVISDKVFLARTSSPVMSQDLWPLFAHLPEATTTFGGFGPQFSAHTYVPHGLSPLTCMYRYVTSCFEFFLTMRRSIHLLNCGHLPLLFFSFPVPHQNNLLSLPASHLSFLIIPKFLFLVLVFLISLLHLLANYYLSCLPPIG